MDSLTNVFGVTEVTGLKWVCLAVGDHRQHSPKNAEADLVLTTYRLCLAQGHLCTWRRKPNASHDAIFNDPAPKIEAEKELWIFWYALNEPKCVEEFKEKYGLSACRDYESSEVALNYETRLLFYKAMHSAFERNLMKAGYLRFARWFVRPAEMPPLSGFPGIDSSRRRSLPSHVNAVNFHFFIHGETSVCMTVNVQHQPTLVRLSSRAFLSQLRTPQQVILAPWSLRGRLLADQSLLLSGVEKPATASSSSSNYQNEPQKLARLQWTHWKTEFPEMAAYEGELDRGGLPRMVLVEVGRVRMLYPTCFVAVVVDEMPHVWSHDGRDMATTDRDSSIAAQMRFEDACSASDTCEPLGHMTTVKLENGNGEHSSWHMADYVKRESCHCRLCTPAADCELLPSTSASAAMLGRCSTGDFPGKAFHGRTHSRNFKGRRAAGSNVVSELVLAASAFVSELSSLRIPSTHAHEEKGLEQWELPPLWARALSSGSSNSKTRDLLLTARLDPGALSEADVLKTLSFNAKQFNLSLPPPVFTPFSPVSSIHYDPVSDPFDDQTLQRLRDFDYAYNPLKENAPQCAAESYHLTEEVEKEMLVGPPRGRREDSEHPLQQPLPPLLPLSQRADEEVRRSSAYNDAEGPSSILKSLLNNHSADGNSRRGASDGDKEQYSAQFSSKLMRGGVPKLAVHHRQQPSRRIVHMRHGSLEKRRRRRKIIWPSVDNLDVLLVARMLDEEPTENAYSDSWHEGSREFTVPTHAQPSLMAQLLRCEATILGAVPQPQSTTAVDPLGTNNPPGGSGESVAHMEVVVDSVAITDATAATPPALLSTESCDDGETSTTKKDGEGKDGPIGSAGDSPADRNTSIAKAKASMPDENDEEVGGNIIDQQQPRSIPPPHSSDHLHNILSPPASNEAQLESLQQPGSSGSSIGALLSQQTLLNNSMQPPLSHEVSFPYPTPPTPMQFSPQGGLLTTTTHLVGAELLQNCSHYSGSIAQPPASTSVFSAMEDSSSPVQRKRRLTVEEFSASKGPTLIEHLFNELLASENGRNELSEEEVFNGTAEVQFPECASFSGDLLGGVGKLSTRLEQLCSHASYEQKKELKSALKARVKRRKLGAERKTALYRKNLVERMRLPSMDAILASQLERAEMERALIASSPHRNSLGPVSTNNRHSGAGGVSPHSLNPQRSNSIRQQHSMGASASGGFSPTGQSLVSPTGQLQHSPHRASFARLPPPPLPLSTPSSSLLQSQGQRNAPLEYQLSSISSASSTSSSSIPPSASGVLPVTGRMFSALAMDSGAMMANQLSSCNSSTIGALMRDTLLDAHYDAVFDSCPICCCTASIVASREFGMFITANDEMRSSRCMSNGTPQRTLDDFSGLRLPPIGQDGVPTRCNCGFSSARHRLLCDRAQHGLFLDDVVEACGRRALAPHHPPQNAMHNFDPAATKERRLTDLLRHLSISRDLFPSSMHANHATPAASRRQYTVSRLELEEIEGAAVSVTRSLGTRGGDSTHFQALNVEESIVHSWGMQLAAASCPGLGEPRESEYLAEMREIRSITEEVVRRAREGAQSFSSKLEPLSWRSLLKRSVKQALPIDSCNGGGGGGSGGGGGGDESNLRAEPLPHLIVAAEREPVMVSPQAISMWEKLSLAPYDQTKDVLYVGIAPDDVVVVEKLRVYLEELSRTYEKCRFGSHARLATASSSPSSSRREPVRDPILRIPLAAAPSSCSGDSGRRIDETQGFGGGGSASTHQLSSFAQVLERELLRFFRENDAVFERRSYHESLLRHNYTQHSHTSLGNSAETNACVPGMPPFAPPHLPIQSPNSILSSTSGPHSTTIAMISPSSSSLLSNVNNQQQPSPLVSTAPNSSNSAPNPTSTTPDSMLIPSDTAVDALSQHQLQMQQAQLEEFETRLSKAVDDVLSFESASYLPHIIVLYVVNPFGFGRMGGGEREKVECQSKTTLLQTFSTLLHQLNVKRRPQLQLEILDLRTVLDYVAFTADEWSRTANAAQDGLRRLALATYEQPRLLLADYLKGTVSKSMTRFGPASTFADILQPTLQGETRIYKFPSSAYIIAPPRSISVLSGGKLQLMNNEERVLFVSYCLVQGRWLCGALTDGSGHLLDTVLININASHEEGRSWRYRQKSQVYDALNRLWLYVQGFLSGGETRNWRIVMGRVGKIGHIEFRVWNDLLSKKSLRSYNNLLKSSESKCRPCASTPGHTQIAAIVSACLISIEPEPYLRLFLSAQQGEAGLASLPTSAPATSTSAMASTMSASSVNGASLSTKSTSSSRSSKLPAQSSTPAANTLSDTSLTLIMAFPATTSISFEPEQSGQLSGQADVSEMEAFFSADLSSSHQLETDISDDIMNIFDGEGFPELNTKLEGEEEDEGSIANQPIATGFYISSAPAPDLPDWFWSTCPSQKGKTPVHLKSSLHIHSANVQQSDEITIGGKGGPEAHHPLDSMDTDEVLRYALQSYNALSWLNVDFANGNRLSCLPMHIQVLLRLCRGTDCISRL